MFVPQAKDEFLNSLAAVLCRRHFVKPYSKLAEKSLARMNKVNQGKSLNRKGKHDLHFTAVDCAEYAEICSQAEVRSYPTLIVYRDGKPQGTCRQPLL
jgi:hypothetical protein